MWIDFSIVYIGTDILGSLVWGGYSYISQTVSELSAIGAPSRFTMIPLFTIYSLLVIAFGFGIRKLSFTARSLRILSILMIAYGIICLFGPFAPMHLRGESPGLTDTMHIALTIVTVILIFLILGFSVNRFGKTFRVYTILTILLVLVFGSLTGKDGAKLAANEPTPWMGLTERINIYAFMIWVAVLSLKLKLMHQRNSGASVLK